eukprot:12319295-Alexandrium_andersonii.AAC.1
MPGLRDCVFPFSCDPGWLRARIEEHPESPGMYGIGAQPCRALLFVACLGRLVHTHKHSISASIAHLRAHFQAGPWCRQSRLPLCFCSVAGYTAQLCKVIPRSESELPWSGMRWWMA